MLSPASRTVLPGSGRSSGPGDPAEAKAQWYLYDEVLHRGTDIYLKDEKNVVIRFQDLGPAPLDKAGALDQEILQHSCI
jgi:hypothetical protein